MIDPQDYLEDRSGRHAARYASAISDLLTARVRRDRDAASGSIDRLADVMRETMGVCAVLGASLSLQAAARVLGQSGGDQEAQLFAAARTQDVVPRVTFDEALDDLVTRVPKTIREAAQRTASEIAKMYAKERVIAFARAADEEVTAAAAGYIERAMRSGYSEGDVGKALQRAVDAVRVETEPWSRAYARMVFRTNANTATTAGRFRAVRDAGVQDLIPAMRFVAVGDADTRPNHAAAHGIVLSIDSPEWARIAPPLGYNCRCTLEHVTAMEIEDAGKFSRTGKVIDDRVPSAAGPDPGFRHAGRPDIL